MIATTGAAAAGALGFTYLSRTGAKHPTSPPNVLFIMADDLGYADVGCYGRQTYETPILDALARQGLRFSNAYANSSVCSATRIGLITGRYQDRFRAGLELPLDTPDLGLPPGTTTMPGLFKSLGYRTSLIGKWHIGVSRGVRPLDHGYDSFYGIYGGATDYYRYAEMPEGAQLVENGRPVKDGRYLTDLLGDKACQQIAYFSKLNTPFFLSFHFTAPHWPWEEPGQRPASEGPVTETSIIGFDGGSTSIFGRMVKHMDMTVGRLLDALNSAGVADNTIVVFTSDNGGERFSDVWPLTGMKSELLEGGIRVPLIMRWPGRIAAGRTTDQVMISMDFMPTLLSAAGMQSIDKLHIDGSNLLPQILDAASPVRSRTLHWRFKARGQQAIRQGTWKYLAIDGEEYLFDLAFDERERANLKYKNPEKFQELKRLHTDWIDQMLPYPNDSFAHDIRSYLADR